MTLALAGLAAFALAGPVSAGDKEVDRVKRALFGEPYEITQPNRPQLQLDPSARSAGSSIGDDRGFGIQSNPGSSSLQPSGNLPSYRDYRLPRSGGGGLYGRDGGLFRDGP